MPLTDSYKRLKLDLVVVDREDRQRRDVDVEDLLPSVKRNGVLQPIIVDPLPDGKYKLVAGERRLVASQRLGIETIPARLSKDLSPVEHQILELTENIKRKDLDWKDLVEATARVHKLFAGLDPDWTMGETAEEIGLSLGTVSLYLKVQGEMNSARVSTAGTVREAYNMLNRRDQRKMGQALQDLISITDSVVGPKSEPKAQEPGPNGEPMAPVEPKPKPPDVLCQSFLEWAPRYEGPKFNLIHCDFPFGIGVFAGPQGNKDGEAYTDRPEDYWNLLDCLLGNLDRLLSLSGHLMFWYSDKLGTETKKRLAEKAPSLTFIPYSLIWFKSDNVGIVEDVRRKPRHVYETCLLGYRGDRHLVMPKADCYPCPTDRTLHASTKPEPMLRHFMSMLVDETTSLLDPTCGAGSSLRAADSLGANRVFGMDISAEYVERAQDALNIARALREASQRMENAS